MADLKDKLYGRYQAQEDRQNKLAFKMASKALDIPDDDMQITNVRSGVGTAGLIVTALAAGLPSAILAAVLLMRGNPTPKADSHSSQEYQLEQWDGAKWVPANDSR